MIEQLSQDSIAEYASDAQTIDEPLGTDYSQGVRVGRTVPAKWWNWLFSAVTKRAGQSKSDAQNMLTELQNVVTDAGITLNPNDDTQLSQAVSVRIDKQIDRFIDKKSSTYLTQWLAHKQIYLNDAPWEPVEYNLSPVLVASDIYGTVFATDLNGAAGSDPLGYSLDGIHWYSISRGLSTVAAGRCCMLGTYLYMFERRSIIRADISGGGRVTSELFGQVEGTYGTVVVPFSDCIYCFRNDGVLYKITNESTVGEVIDSTHLGQIEFGQSATDDMALVNYPVLVNDKYYIGNVRTNLDRSVWEPLTSVPSSSSSFYQYSIASLVNVLPNDNIVIAPRYQSSRKDYYVMDTQGTTQQITVTSFTQESSARFVLDLKGYVLLYIPYLFDPTKPYSLYSADGINFTSFSFRIFRFCYTAGYYYLMTYAEGEYVLFVRHGNISSNLTDYTELRSFGSINYTAPSIYAFVEDSYIAVVNGTREQVTFPGYSGSYYMYAVLCIINKDIILDGTPKMLWADGAVTNLYTGIIGNVTKFTPIGGSVVGHVPLGDSQQSPLVTLTTSRGVNFVQGHTLYLQ